MRVGECAARSLISPPRAGIPIRFLYFSSLHALERLCTSADIEHRRSIRSPHSQQAQRCRRQRRRPSSCLSFVHGNQESPSMMDVILVGTTAVFFALCFAYARVCDWL
ncbi:hypothetical protein E2F50_12290 [Rhizobium deserti]|uniref:Uncharacterized protein n=1 Tax=Rhizobium deserti TaxID=2547961 RepID=A0A4R5UGK1_9HYPH|nr:hypothetical protein E2F50_12290 [Rhizobium deserti]